MSDEGLREHDQHRNVQRTEHQAGPPAATAEGLFAPAVLPADPGSLLGDPRLNGRGNQPVKLALMRQVQQTYGNRTTQRFLQRASAMRASVAPTVQRQTARHDQEDEEEAKQPAQIQRTPATGSLPDSVQRKPPQINLPEQKVTASFAPQVTRTPDIQLAHLNDEISQSVNVTNANKAPSGTGFRWQWEGLDKKLQAVGTPPTTPQATLKAKPKEVGSTTAVPRVDYWSPNDFAGPDEGYQSATAKPVQVSIAPPQVEFNYIIIVGGQSKDKVRPEGKVFQGDTLSVSATFSDVTDPQNAGLNMGFKSTSGLFGLKGEWSGGMYLWNLTAQKAGKTTLTFSVQAPGMDKNIEHVMNMSVVFDLEHFTRQVVGAQSLANARLGAAAAATSKAGKAYMDAYNAQKEILTQKAGEEALKRDLALAAIFGALGGATAGVIKGALGDSARSVGGEAFTDMAKDTVKFGRNVLPVLGANPNAGEAEQGQGADGDKGAKIGDRGDNNVSGEDPAELLNRFAGKIGEDQNKVHNKLAAVILEANKKSAAGSTDLTFDEDPVEYVTRDVTVDTISKGMVQDKQIYLQQLWHAWLPGNIKKGLTWISETEPGGRSTGYVIDGWLHEAAKQCGEKATDWVEKYAPGTRMFGE